MQTICIELLCITNTVACITHSQLHYSKIHRKNIQHTIIPTATDDMIKVATYLSSLSKEEVKTLGMVLGLSDTTVRNNYDGSSASSYLDSILRAWFGKKDKVTQNG